MRRRGRPVFVAFDLLWLNGRDVREITLTKRKTLLRAIVPQLSQSILYAHHVKRDGRALFETICQHDLEGIVAKLARGRYDVTVPTWVKIKNPHYSQRDGRHELFQRRE
jgi:bifunctional non-homologous end joining protein LigD